MENRHETTSERLREHLGRAARELQNAQQFLDPGTRDEARLVGAIADAKTLAADTLKSAWQLEGGDRG